LFEGEKAVVFENKYLLIMYVGFVTEERLNLIKDVTKVNLSLETYLFAFILGTIGEEEYHLRL
jgi:hypothetical protein